MSRDQTPAGVQITGQMTPEYAEILTADALAFLAKLHRTFNARRLELLQRRVTRQAKLDAGEMPAFLAETQAVRAADWKVAPVPADLQDRRVEITGPTDRKMVINALNCGASTYMADFEDSNTPTWDNQVQGQINMRDAVRRTIDFASPEGKHYKLNDKIATLLVRPRGWHLDEKHLLVDGKPMSGSLFDFGLYFFHNAKERVKQRLGHLPLPAQDGEPSGSAAVERGLRACAERARRTAGHRQGHRADRDHPRRLRDGRDPLRAARALRRAQLRALGLHLLVHQEAARQARLHPRRPRAGHHDLALHARLLAAADQDLPPPRRLRDGRHGGADPDQERSRRQRAGHRQGAHGQGARSQRRARRHLGRASRPGCGRQGRRSTRS